MKTLQQACVPRDSVFKDRDGYLYATCPPLRKKADQAALWGGIERKLVDVVATDHCSFTRAQKAITGAVEHPFVGENGARGVVRGGGSESRSGLDFGMAERWLDRTEGLFGGSE